jgi:ribonucleoside-diphosphate reductase alpha chain
MDYIFRWLGAKFVKEDRAETESEFDASGDLKRVSQVVATGAATPIAPAQAAHKVEVIDATNGHANGRNGDAGFNPSFNFIARTDAPTCPECGSIMIPNGSCHKCVNCGTTSGCS